MCFLQQLARYLKKVMGNLFSARKMECQLVPKNNRPIIGKVKPVIFIEKQCT